MGIYAIMLPSVVFSVAHSCVFITSRILAKSSPVIQGKVEQAKLRTLRTDTMLMTLEAGQSPHQVVLRAVRGPLQDEDSQDTGSQAGLDRSRSPSPPRPKFEGPVVKYVILNSRYLAQNDAIWLADEVLSYRDHDTLRCQNDIRWQNDICFWKN